MTSVFAFIPDLAVDTSSPASQRWLLVALAAGVFALLALRALAARRAAARAAKDGDKGAG